MKLAMTSIAVIARSFASASEVAFRVASFIQTSLNLVHATWCSRDPYAELETGPQTSVSITREGPVTRSILRGTPHRRVFALVSPHSANFDAAKFEY